ncbi:MAG: HIT family protein [Cardiobacteriales bacterium]|nr:MAG: HIT family protein [Cardiobacteriales bacterium]
MSILTDIVSGKRPAIKVYETVKFLAIMAQAPNAIGHVICFPKQETHDLFALDNDIYHDFFAFIQVVALGLKEVVPCRKIGMASIGLAVEHVHVHLVPANQAMDMNFMDSKVSVTEEIKQRLAKQIAQKIVQSKS